LFLTFYGAADTVTGSCFMVESAKCRVLVDCGMFQGSKEIKQRNYEPLPFPARSIDYLLLTHAHIDHSGLIPKLVKSGFKGRIIATGCTVDLCGALLPDAGHIQEMEVERINRKARRAGKPLIQAIYTAEDALASLPFFDAVDYDQEISLCPNLRVKFRDAGHILGSALLELWIKDNDHETKFVFSGDLGNEGRPFVKDPTDLWEADCLVIESTYGDRLHQTVDPKELRQKLHDVIWQTYRKGGNLLIPAFAVERTQDIIYDLFLLARENKLPPMDIWVDSPLAAQVTNIFASHHECYDKETIELIANGENPLKMPNLKFAQTPEDSQMLNRIPGGMIIIAGSGMCDAGRIRHHLKHNLWRPEATVLFVGYQAEGTLGRRLLEGEKDVRILGEEICVRADIVNIDGFSAHADQDMLVDWVKGFTVLPQQLFIVHGEPVAQHALRDRLIKDVGIMGIIPKWRETFSITRGRTPYDKLRQATAGFWAKLENYLATEPEPESFAEIMAKVNELERLIVHYQENEEDKRAG